MSRHWMGASAMRHWISTIGLGLMVSASPGCSLALDTNRVQCSHDADCAARGEQFATSSCVRSVCVPDPTWGCLGHPAEAATEGGPFKVVLPLSDVVTQEPLPGVEGTLCRKRDVECTTPASKPTLSDASGNLVVEVPANFDGYVMLRSAATSPFLYFFNPVIKRDGTLPSVPLTNPLVFSLLVSQLTGSKPLAESGAILLTAADCNHAAAGGVALSTANSSAEMVGFYSVDGLPNGQAPATDTQGYGGFVNVPPGSVAVTGTLAATQHEVATISLIVRAGFISYSQVGPDGP